LKSYTFFCLVIFFLYAGQARSMTDASELKPMSSKDISECGNIQAIYMEKIRYPSSPTYKKDYQDGEVVFEYVIDINGLPTDIKVIEATNKSFEDVAIMSFKKWKYEKREMPCKGKQRFIWTLEE